MKLSTCRLLGLWVFFLSIPIEHAHAEQSPLLELTHQLHCAPTEQEAATLLVKLASLSAQPFGIPSDNFNRNEKSLLYAATVDILLHVLYETIQHYPNLQEPAERAALLWNYCEMMTDDGIANLAINNVGEIIKQQSINSFPEKKQGFSIWGFLKADPANRYVPKIVQETAIWPLAHQDLVFRLFQQQCFPHPDTGALVNEYNDSQPPPFGSLGIKQKLELGEHYPYLWQSDCTKAITPIKPNNPLSKLKPPPKFEQNSVVTQKQTVIFNPKPLVTLKPTVQTNAKTKNLEPASTVGQKILDIVSRKYAPPKNGEVPMVSTAIAGTNSNSGAPLPLPPADGLGIAGNFYNRSKLTEGQSAGANISWHPISSFFIAGGVNYNYYPSNSKLSYSWGIGYDDWHPGTFSVQLNNWGPNRLNEGLAFKKAVANIGYKFEADFLRPYNITGSAAVSIPIKGDPSISTTWSWSPVENWFIRGSLQRKFGSQGGFSWSYNFGYSDWHPFTFSLTYDNWGPNPIWDAKQGDVFNARKNGAISLGWGWAF